MSDHVMSEVVLQVSCSRCCVKLLHDEQVNNYTQMMTFELVHLERTSFSMKELESLMGIQHSNNINNRLEESGT